MEFKQHTGQNYGFDEYVPEIPQFYVNYGHGKVNNENYHVAWKSAESFGPTDLVKLEITATVPDSIKSRLSIETETGQTLHFAQNPNDKSWELGITGQVHESINRLTAWYKQDDGSRVAVGYLDLASYQRQQLKVNIVPVKMPKQGSEQQIKDYLNKVYSQAITSWDVAILDPLEVEFEDNDTDGLDTELPGIAAYTKEMRTINDAMKARSDYDPDAYYLFLIPKSEKGDKNGIMPFARHFGYIFMDATKDAEKQHHTMAHELGHSLSRHFSCRERLLPQTPLAGKRHHGRPDILHYVRENNVLRGTKQNICLNNPDSGSVSGDYKRDAPNTHLYKYQWDEVHNPKISLFGGEEDETSETNQIEIEFIDPGILADQKPETENCLTFLSPSGQPVSITGVKSPVFKVTSAKVSPLPEKALYSFIYNSTEYHALFSKLRGEPWKFEGYVPKNQLTDKATLAARHKNKQLDYYKDETPCPNRLDDKVGYQVRTGLAETDIATCYVLEAKNNNLKPDLNYCFNECEAFNCPDLKTLTFSDLFKSHVDVTYKANWGGTLAQYNINGETIHIFSRKVGDKWYHYSYVEGKSKCCEQWQNYTLPEPEDYELLCLLLSEGGHSLLDVFGFVPIAGEVADALNGVWYLIEGENGEAALCMASMIPVVGDFGGKGIKYIRKVGAIKRFAENTAKLSDISKNAFKNIADFVNKSEIPDAENIIEQAYNLILKNSDKAKNIEKVVLKFDNATDLKAILGDLAKNDNFAKEFLEKVGKNEGLVESWKMLQNRPKLRLKTDALESVSNLLNNPSRTKLGLIDEVIGNIHASRIDEGSFKAIIDDLDALGKKIADKTDVEFENFNSLLGKLNDNNTQNSQAAQWIIQDITENIDDFAGKKWKFEATVTNSDGSAAFIDAASNEVPPKRIEYKWLTSATVGKDDFIREFIKRDLFNATDLNKIEWRIKGQKLSKEKVAEYLSSTEGKDALKKISAEKANTLLKRTDLDDDFPDEIANAFIEFFNATSNFNLIFK